MSKNYTEMKGWKYMFGSNHWTGEDAMWVKRLPAKKINRNYYRFSRWMVLRFTDLLDAGGKSFKDTPYECEVRYVDFDDVPKQMIDSALMSNGWVLKNKGTEEDEEFIVVDEHSGDLIAESNETVQYVILESLIGYGGGAPLYTATGKRYLNVRAEARREAMMFIRDKGAFEAAMDRPVNDIGSTAREYGRGDIDSALHRGPFDMKKNLMRKIEGLPPKEPDANVVTFAKLDENGQVTVQAQVKQSDIRKCKFAIILPEHYREDGSCKCDDHTHRNMMIEAWDYKQKDFEGIPLRPVVG